MKITEVRYSAKNKKCTSLKPLRFLVNTENFEIAKDVALEELKEITKHWELYAPICMWKTILTVE